MADLAAHVDRAVKRQATLSHIARFSDDRGSLCVVDWAETLPFTPDRLYYIHNVSENAKRAGHAHFQGEELILSLVGSVSVLVDNGCDRKEFNLNRPEIGLYIPALVWHELHGFSPGAVCAVLASGHHSEEDYCRDYQQFLEHATGRTPWRPLS